MRRTALALSPHLDDAVFSCGGTLTRLARAGWRVIVATLFTGSVPNPKGFALACQLDKGLGPEVDYMALRRAEDAAAMLALGIEPPVHLPLLEAPHRGYESAPALFEPPHESDRVIGALRTAVASLLAEHRPDLVLSPQAIGGHVDHVQLVRALQNTYDDDGIGPSILWWRDFPYVARSADPAEPFRDWIRRLPEHGVELDAEALAIKEVACLAYTSQLDFQFSGPDGLRAKLAQAGNTEYVRGTVPPSLEPV